jgi:hypothetical protein
MDLSVLKARAVAESPPQTTSAEIVYEPCIGRKVFTDFGLGDKIAVLTPWSERLVSSVTEISVSVKGDGEDVKLTIGAPTVELTDRFAKRVSFLESR